MKINVRKNNEIIYSLETSKQITIGQLSKLVEDKYPYPIYYSKLNNAYRSFKHVIKHDSDIEFLDMQNHATSLVYQNSLILLYIKAVHDLYGKTHKITLHNALNKGLFTTTNFEVNEQIINDIENKMKELVAKDILIERIEFTRQEALDFTLKNNQKETYELLKSISSIRQVSFFKLDDEIQCFDGNMVLSTGYIKLFKLVPYKNGIIILYPTSDDPLHLPQYINQVALYNAFALANRFHKIMDIETVTDLNNKIKNNEVKDMLLMQEALHEKNIADLASQIVTNNKRVVLICGPSSSGKTTFANRLIYQIKALGKKTLYLGTDDFFKERVDSPKDENGNYDFECLECLDIDLFENTLKKLISGEQADIPTFNFISGKKEFGKRITSITNDTIIVIEGIHGLNPKLTPTIDNELKYKIYISPLTSIAIDKRNRISVTDCRILRRMLRDYRTRNYSPADTIKSWPSVRNGETKNIFPFINDADAFFNSNLVCELSILKKQVEPLLQSISRDEEEYGEAQRLLSFIKFFESIEDNKYVLNNSILREFIGGSIILDE